MGKTGYALVLNLSLKKNPHGRGEDLSIPPSLALIRETPPRAWGRLTRLNSTPLMMRNTPTGVGKTQAKPLLCQFFEKHPHGRGEDTGSGAERAPFLETPPRAWGRLGLGDVAEDMVGNTPTGVGKTDRRSAHPMPLWKHPHGRGEDREEARLAAIALETPPRAWGRPCQPEQRGHNHGNTPTGVGKTA